MDAVSSKSITELIRRHDGSLDVVLILALLLTNIIVLVNAVISSPDIGYDSSQHRRIIEALPERIPTKDESREFFSPPLPYIVPSIARDACIASTPSERAEERCWFFAAKVGQAVNALISVAISIWLLGLADFLAPNDREFKLASIVLFGLLTLRYKALVMIRGEPYIAFFCTWVLVFIARRLKSDGLRIRSDGLKLGALLAAIALSRQWGLLVFPALVSIPVVLRRATGTKGAEWDRVLLISTVVSVCVAGPWYLFLLFRYGSLTAFQYPSQGFSLGNHPVSFYLSLGLSNLQLFKAPIREVFNNYLLPLFYSDFWGDYWGYFVFVRESSQLGMAGFANRETIGHWLGLANAAGVLPVGIFSLGFMYSIRRVWDAFRVWEVSPQIVMEAVISSLVAVAIAGFSWFVVAYPMIDHVKPIYVLHAAIVLPLLGARIIVTLRDRFPSLSNAVWAWLVLMYITCFPIWITRYVFWR